MARTPKVIAAQRAVRLERKRKSSEVSMQIDHKNEEDLFVKLLNLNHDIANI